MSAHAVAEYWRRGWRALLAVLLVNLGFAILNFLAGSVLPDDSQLRWWVALFLVLSVGPILAGATYRTLFSSTTLPGSTHSTIVATFSDEVSAHIAASALEHSGISAVVTTAAIGQQSGIPVPVGGVQLLVSRHDLARAEAVLATARKPASRA